MKMVYAFLQTDRKMFIFLFIFILYAYKLFDGAQNKYFKWN